MTNRTNLRILVFRELNPLAALIVAAAKATKEKEEEEERAAKAAEEAKKTPLERLHAPSIVPSLFSDSENPLATYFDVAVIRYVNPNFFFK